MAQGTNAQWTMQERADNYLAILLRRWEAIPAIAAEWEARDEFSRLIFDAEWGGYEDKLHRLVVVSQDSLLTPEQRTRYNELLGLVTAYRPLIERLLSGKN